ncbi:hypothetical protein M404DRAFT_30883 [Pisolithus tinctorius Marx 270]|uniref:Uncharacterized protein n=1 Tax=Pisolithus tinctorius Marx 270 TaxID=870435 RepID=A0A0C3JN19_PISTI|nr:hypothetical protein M404DRAFT_30883 [Pisolithus tinctorius Marx 270]
MVTLEPVHPQQEANELMRDVVVGTPHHVSPTVFSPPPSTSQSPPQSLDSVLLYPESPPDGFDVASAFPVFHPIPVQAFPPPTSPFPSEFVNQLTQELQSADSSGLGDNPTLAQIHRQIRREECQSLVSLLTSLAHHTPHLPSLYLDSNHALARERGTDESGVPAPLEHYHELEGSAYVRFYPHLLPQASPTQGSASPPPDLLSDSVLPASHVLPNGITALPQTPSPSSPGPVIIQEKPTNGSHQASLLFCRDTVTPDSEATFSIFNTSYCSSVAPTVHDACHDSQSVQLGNELCRDPYAPGPSTHHQSVQLSNDLCSHVQLPGSSSDIGHGSQSMQLIDELRMSHHLSSLSPDIPTTLLPLDSDMFNTSVGSHFYLPSPSLLQPAQLNNDLGRHQHSSSPTLPMPLLPSAPQAVSNAVVGEGSVAMPEPYSNVVMHHTPTGWIAHLQEATEDHSGDVDEEDSGLFQESGLDILARAVSFTSASVHPSPFKAVSY